MTVGKIRQGDILLVPEAAAVPPKDAARTEEVVLAWGEVTGHAHRVRATQVLEWETEGQRYILVEGSERGWLSHEDHDPTPAQVLEPNVAYRVVQQRQWSLADEWEDVRD